MLRLKFFSNKMLNPGIMRWVVLLSTGCLVTFNFAQNNRYKPQNEKLIQEADSLTAVYEVLTDSSSRDGALDIYLDLAAKERKDAHPDTAALIHCQFKIGYIDMLWGQYKWGMEAFEKMMLYVQRPRDQHIINEAIPFLGFCYRQTRIENFTFHLPVFSKTKRKEFYFPISKVWPREGDSITVKINFGTYDGIGLGAFGKTIGVKNPAIYGHNNIWLGYCEVTEIAESQAILRIFDLPNVMDSVHMIYKNDLVKLPIQYPTRFSDVVTEAVSNNIIFYNIEGYSFYDYRQWYIHANDTLLEDIILAMQHDIHLGYEKYKNSDIKVLTQVGKKGRFKDITLLEALRTTSRKDLLDFFYYATFYRSSYYGQSSLISKYADWVLDDCPVSYGEFFEAVDQATTESELSALAEKYKEACIEHDLFTYLGNDEELLVETGNPERAFAINEKHRKLTVLMNLPEQTGWCYFFKARMHDSRDEHDMVLKDYETALNIFKKASDVRGEGLCIGNLAAKYYDLSDYKKSLEYYHKSYLLKSKIKTTDSSDYYKSVAIARHGMGDANYMLNLFDSALANYTKAAQFYQKANSVDARSRSLSAYKYIAKILKKQAKYNEAYKAYAEQKERYKQLGDQKNVAETFDNMADVLFSLNDYQKSADNYNSAYKLKLGWGDKDGAGFSKSATGQALYNLGEYDKAIAAHDSAVKLREEANNQSGVAYSLTQIGSLYKENGEYSKASDHFDRAYKIYENLGYKSSLADLANKRGFLEQKINNQIKALELFKIALKNYTELNDRIEMGNSYYNIASVYAKKNDLKLAIENLDTALKIQEATGDQAGQMYTLNYKASLVDLQFNDKQKALALYHQGLKMAKLTGSPYNIALCQNSLGALYSNMGIYSKAKPYYDSSYQIYIQIKDRVQQSYALVNVGYYYTGIGNFSEGEKCFMKALKVAEEIKNNNAMANAYAALGSIGRVTGHFEKSVAYLEKGIEIYVKSDNPWGVASNFIEIGNLNNEQSKYVTAVSFYMKADSIYKKLDNEFARATPLNNAGTIFFHQGNYDSSLSYFLPTYDILKRKDAEGDFINLVALNIGEVYVMDKKYPEAERWLNLGLNSAMKREDKRNKGIGLRIMAKYHIKRQKYKEAEVVALQAYQIVGDSGEIENTTDIYNQLGRVKYELKEYEACIKWLEKTIRKSEPVGFKKYLYEAYYYSALSYYALNEKDTALRRIKRAITVMEQISGQITGGAEAQKLFTSGDLQQKMYETVVEWLLAQGRIEEAILFLERGNNEALNAKFKQLKGGETGAKGETQKEIAEVEEKKKALEQIEAEIVKEKSKPADQQKTKLIAELEAIKQVGQKEYKSFLENLVKTNPKIQVYISNSVNPDDFRAEKKNISPDMAVLLYLMAEKNLYIFCATKDSVFAKVVNLEAKDLSKKIMTISNIVRNPGFLPTTRRGSKTVNNTKIDNPEKVLNDLSKELYTLLIGSVKAEIGNKTRLAIIPNGDLYYLPFHALIKSEENKKITYLMDEYTVFYSNRLKFLGSSQEVDLESFVPLAIGNADKSLPNAEIEVNDIKRLIPQSSILVGDKATKSELIAQSGNFRVLHFATHGIMDYNNFDSSYLVMAPDKKTGDNGHFTLNDISNLNGIDEYTLVVLSACETAVKNDLVEGWPQTTASAFLTAGVETVFATLWPVDDKSTQLIMTRFYENIMVHKMSKIEALKNAQIEVSKVPGMSHPYYWAPFAYYGK